MCQRHVVILQDIGKIDHPWSGHTQTGIKCIIINAVHRCCMCQCAITLRPGDIQFNQARIFTLKEIHLASGKVDCIELRL